MAADWLGSATPATMGQVALWGSVEEQAKVAGMDPPFDVAIILAINPHVRVRGELASSTSHPTILVWLSRDGEEMSVRHRAIGNIKIPCWRLWQISNAGNDNGMMATRSRESITRRVVGVAP